MKFQNPKPEILIPLTKRPSHPHTPPLLDGRKESYNNQDKSTINKAVKEVLTRHSASGSTIEWLFEHSCERLRMGERREDFYIGFEEVRLKCVDSLSRERCALRTKPTKVLPDLGAASSENILYSNQLPSLLGSRSSQFISGHYSLLLLCDHYSGLHGKLSLRVFYYICGGGGSNDSSHQQG